MKGVSSVTTVLQDTIQVKNPEALGLYFSAVLLARTWGAHYCSTAAPPAFPHNADGTLSPGEIQTLPHVHWGNKCWSGSLTTSVVKGLGRTATPKHSTGLLESQMPTST